MNNYSTKNSNKRGLKKLQSLGWTHYLRSRLKDQERWEETSNERDLLRLIKIIKSLLQKYNDNTEYHHIAYHMLLCQLILLRKGDYSNLD